MKKGEFYEDDHKLCLVLLIVDLFVLDNYHKWCELAVSTTNFLLRTIYRRVALKVCTNNRQRGTTPKNARRVSPILQTPARSPCKEKKDTHKTTTFPFLLPSKQICHLQHRYRYGLKYHNNSSHLDRHDLGQHLHLALGDRWGWRSTNADACCSR